MTIDWRDVLAVALGGGLGSSLRYILGIFALQRFGPAFPWSTLAINLSGSLLIGLLGEFALGRTFGANGTARLFLMVGFLGGYTTFSAFSLEGLGLIMHRPPLVALGYIGGSVVLGLAFCYLGIVGGRFLMHL